MPPLPSFARTTPAGPVALAANYLRQHGLVWALLGLLLALQGQIWIGRGSVFDVRRMQTRLIDVKTKNTQIEQTNRQLEAEVLDLKEGLAVVEDKARFELGMVKPGEVFVKLER